MKGQGLTAVVIITALALVSNALWFYSAEQNAVMVKNAEGALKSLPAPRFYVGDHDGKLLVFCHDPAADTLTILETHDRGILVDCSAVARMRMAAQ